MKKDNSITFDVEFDLNNPKVKKWLKEKSKVKKLEDITFEEIINECPEAMQFKTVQGLSTEKQKWHLPQLEDKTEIIKILKQHRISKYLDRYRDRIEFGINAEKILDILNKEFYPQTVFLDILKDVQGHLNLRDGRLSQLCDKAQEELTHLQRDKSKGYQKAIAQLSNQIDKAKGMAKLSRRDTLSPGNPYVSSIQMIEYQALALYEYFRKVIPKKFRIITDRKLYAVIGDCLNARYKTNEYNSIVVKNYIENALEHRDKNY